jgi:Protein of unknown function (DUF4238)
MTAPVNHHLVSAGYQRNFANDQRRLAVVNARTGDLAPRLRAVKSNWVEKHWNSVTDPRTGRPDTSLEETFSRIESTVLNHIKTVRIGSLSPEQAGAIVNLFAIHLARSRSFRQWQLAVHDEHVEQIVRETAGSPQAIARFEQQYGRPPAPGELEAMAQEIADRSTVSGQWNVEGMARHHDSVVDRLTKLHIQVIEVTESLPGLVIGDVPVVHADTATGRFGYRDRLAFGDANLIVGPLTRRVAVCFSQEPERPVKVTTKKLFNQVNGIFVRAALAEVACHPDDALNLQRVCRDLPPLPPLP